MLRSCAKKLPASSKGKLFVSHVWLEMQDVPVGKVFSDILGFKRERS